MADPWPAHMLDDQPETNTDSVGFELAAGSNLCYRNVGILLLLHTAFAEWSEKDKDAEQINCAEPIDGDCTLCRFHKLVQVYWHGNQAQDEHETAMDLFWMVYKTIGGWHEEDSIQWGKQQDVLEFLQHLLGTLTDHRHGPLHNERTNEIKPPGEIASVAGEYIDKCTQCDYIYKTETEKELEKKRENMTKEEREEHERDNDKYSYLFHLTVVPSPSSRNLSDFMEHTWRRDLETNCPECKGKMNRSINIRHPPEVLTLSIETDSGKFMGRVDVPEEYELPLDLVEMRDKPARLAYKPRAIVFHSGRDMAEGHYTIGVLQKDGKWWYLDNNDDPYKYDSLEQMIDSAANFQWPTQVYLVVGQREMDGGWATEEPQASGSKSDEEEGKRPEPVDTSNNEDAKNDMDSQKEKEKGPDQPPQNPQPEQSAPKEPAPEKEQPAPDPLSTTKPTESLNKKRKSPPDPEPPKDKETENEKRPGPSPKKKRHRVYASVRVKVWSPEYGMMQGTAKMPMSPYNSRGKPPANGNTSADVSVNIREEEEQEVVTLD